ncbi:MAG: acetyltransferase [Crocinitomicaceae bacterium]
MLIVGAKGFAKEILGLLTSLNECENEEIAFFDNIDLKSQYLYEDFSILHDEVSVKNHFLKYGSSFVLGVGNPKVRRKLHELMISFGGEEKTLISKNASVGQFGTTIGKGSIITDGVRVTNSVTIGESCLLNLNSTIGHDSVIGHFVELCPSVNISGNCHIGEGSFIGTGAILLPGVQLGKWVTVGAGSVVTKSFPDNSKIIGVPGKSV